MVFRKATVEDYPAILKMNEELVHFLAPMDEALLTTLHGQSALTAVIEEDERVAAFMILLREGQDYDSENYRWFSARYPSFLYVDRIVVDPAFHRRGYGKFLYDELFAQAKRDGVPFVTAEVNIEPPNQASLDFHKQAGFGEVGTQWLDNGKKQVSLLLAEIK
ncbi:GNAT family N-acetyltransferase [Ruminococcaceae bacterium OttesenSCG-928-D13]|nr:GNAT family N-acetyltransferase [Ruminococcaceae bacterium OttesenSCG-928-D13]